MTQKKLVIYFMTISILTLTPLPLLNTLFIITTNTDKNHFNKKFLFSTDHLESYLNYFAYTYFNISLNQKDVVTGKDGFLFLGNGINEIIDKTQGIYVYTQEAINVWTDKLKNIQTWYKERDIQFLVVIAPNKHSIYKEKLPIWMKKPHKTITDDIIKYAKKKDIHLLDIRESMKEQKNELLYFMTDTHWNSLGASIAYEETMKYLNTLYSMDYKIAKYSFLNEYRSAGDLTKLLKIYPLLPSKYEKLISLQLTEKSTVCHGYIRQNIHLEKCIKKENPAIDVSRHSHYIYNSSARNEKKALLIYDSFGSYNSQLYNETFQTSWKFHYERLHGKELSNFILKHKPDIVIYQVVERFLYNGFITQDL